MVTFSALVNLIFFSAIAVVLLKIVFRNNHAVLKLDIRFLLVCMLLILLRLFIPVESPLTRNIPVDRFYPDVYMFLKEPLVTVSGFKISILIILKSIWGIGIVFALIKLIFSYLMVKKKIRSLEKLENQDVINAVNEINSRVKRPAAFELMTSQDINTPCVFGILKPYIVIPPIEFTKEELDFVLKHEMLHFYRGDLFIKVFCEMLNVIYWWNPFVHMLCRLISDMQEINVDFKIIKKLPEAEQLDYSECLVKVARIREKKKQEKRWIVAFQKESPSAVHKRISLMLNNLEISKRKTAATVVLAGVILSLIILCPNVMIFEPYAIPSEDAEGTFGISDNIYYLKNADNTYSLYLDGECAGTLKEVYDENIRIYNSLEEAEAANRE